MTNIVQIRNLENIKPYVGEGVWQTLEGLLRAIPPSLKHSDSITLYVASAVHTIVEIDDDTGSYPIAVIAESKGTACWVNLYLDDSGDVTVGTTDPHVSLAVSGTSGDLTCALLLGNGLKTLATEDGLSIAAPATPITSSGNGAVANDPTVYVLYHAA